MEKKGTKRDSTEGITTWLNVWTVWLLLWRHNVLYSLRNHLWYTGSRIVVESNNAKSPAGCYPTLHRSLQDRLWSLGYSKKGYISKYILVNEQGVIYQVIRPANNANNSVSTHTAHAMLDNNDIQEDCFLKPSMHSTVDVMMNVLKLWKKEKRR